MSCLIIIVCANIISQHIESFLLFKLLSFHLFVYIGRIRKKTNYDYDIYFNVSARGKFGGSCNTKVKEKYHAKTKEKKC